MNKEHRIMNKLKNNRLWVMSERPVPATHCHSQLELECGGYRALDFGCKHPTSTTQQ